MFRMRASSSTVCKCEGKRSFTLIGNWSDPIDDHRPLFLFFHLPRYNSISFTFIPNKLLSRRFSSCSLRMPFISVPRYIVKMHFCPGTFAQNALFSFTEAYPGSVSLRLSSQLHSKEQVSLCHQRFQTVVLKEKQLCLARVQARYIHFYGLLVILIPKTGSRDYFDNKRRPRQTYRMSQ